MSSIASRCILILSLCALAGCLTAGEYTPIQRYALNGGLEIETTRNTNLTIGVRPLDYVRFYKEPMVYREGDYAIAYDDFSHWAELPRDAVTRVLIDGLNASGAFADAGYAYALPRPDLIVTGEVRRFDQMRTSDPWTAVCEVRIELRDRTEGAALWGETLFAEAPLASNDAAGFAAAMNEAVAKIITKAVERIVNHAADG